MSRPRISAARSAASSGDFAIFTPPALPRPPVFTCALTTTTGVPIFSAAARASSGVVAVIPRRTGTPCASNMSRAWYSYRSTIPPGSVVRPRCRRKRRLVLRRSAHGNEGRFKTVTSLVLGTGPGPAGQLRARPRTLLRTQSTMSAMVAPGVKTCETPISARGSAIRLRDDPAAEHDDVVRFVLREQIDHLAEQGHVGPGEHGQARSRRRPRPVRSARSDPGSGAGPCR